MGYGVHVIMMRESLEKGERALLCDIRRMLFLRDSYLRVYSFLFTFMKAFYFGVLVVECHSSGHSPIMAENTF